MKTKKYFNILLETTYGEYYTTNKGRYEVLQGCPYDFEEYLNELNLNNSDENIALDEINSYYMD